MAGTNLSTGGSPEQVMQLRPRTQSYPAPRVQQAFPQPYFAPAYIPQPAPPLAYGQATSITTEPEPVIFLGRPPISGPHLPMPDESVNPQEYLPFSLVQMSAPSTTRQAPPLSSAFSTDPRVSFSTITSKYVYEDTHTGEEFEWNEAGKVWLPVFDEELIKAQQAAYRVEGVDESAPVLGKREKLQGKGKKRKVNEVDYTGAGSSNAVASSSTTSNPKPSAKDPKPPKPSTNIYVSHLPLSTTSDQLASIFSRAGLLLTNDDGTPKIKMYTHPDGTPKGDALISYFKEGSVALAVQLFDDSELVLGSGEGNIHVAKAEFSGPSKIELEKEKEREAAKSGTVEKGPVVDSGYGDSSSATVEGPGGPEKKKSKMDPGKRKARERYLALQSKLEDWDSDEESPMAPLGGAPQPGNSRLARVVVLKRMFTQQELKEDPALSLDLKEDVREEAESLGVVTNVVLYDKEEDGVMTVKFKDAISAQACLIKMNGRFFGGRQITAELYTGKERYRQSGTGDEDVGDPDEKEAEDKKRLDAFAAFLVDGDAEDGSPTPA